MNHKTPTLGRRGVLARTQSVRHFRAKSWILRPFLVLAIGIVAALCATPAWSAPAQPVPPAAPGAPTDPNALTKPAASNTIPVQPGSSPCGTGTTDTDPNGAGDSADGATASAVGQGAIDALCMVMTHIDIGTSPQLTTDQNANWFKTEYNMFRVMALWIVVPLLIIATLHSVLKGEFHQILKIYLVYLPVSVVGGVVAVGIVQLLLNMTDQFSATFTNSIDPNAVRFFSGVSDGFGVDGFKAGIDWLVMIIAGILVLFACIGVYIVLVFREASIYIASAFLPIMLAFFVWPATVSFFKKLVEFLFAMIFSKLIMVAGIALAVAAMTTAAPAAGNAALNVNGGQVGQAGQPTALAPGQQAQQNGGTQIATGGGGDEGQPWFVWLGQTMTTVIMFAIVALAPNMTVKLLANVGLPNMGQHVSDHSSRPNVWSKVAFVDRNWTTVTALNRGYRAGQTIPRAQEAARNTTQQDRALNAQGIYRGEGGNYHITDDDLDAANITDDTLRNEIKQRSASNDVNDVSFAHHMLAGRENLEGYAEINGQNVMFANGEAIIVSDTVNRVNGGVLNFAEPRDIRTTAEDLVNRGYDDIRVITPYDAVGQVGAHGSVQFSQVARNQEANARLIQRQLDRMAREVQERTGRTVNARVVLGGAPTASDYLNGGATPAYGASYDDF